MDHDRNPDSVDRPSDKKRPEGEQPNNPAGPHAKPELTNDEATPGAGALPDEVDGGATTG